MDMSPSPLDPATVKSDPRKSIEVAELVIVELFSSMVEMPVSDEAQVCHSQVSLVVS